MPAAAAAPRSVKKRILGGDLETLPHHRESYSSFQLSHSKASKFQTKPFPLYDALGELYDGHIAEGTMNFIFIEPTPSTQVHDVEAQEETENDPSWNVHGVDNSDEDKVIIMDQTHTGDVGTSSRVRSVGDLTNKRANSSIVLTDKEKNGGQKRKKDDRVADMMKRYLELKTKQVEEETAELRRVTTNVDAEQERPRINAPMDFSITSCVVVVNTIQEFLNDEKIDSFDVSKNPQNREIFMAAESTTRVLWRKKKLDLIAGRHCFCGGLIDGYRNLSDCVTYVTWLLAIWNFTTGSTCCYIVYLFLHWLVLQFENNATSVFLKVEVVTIFWWHMVANDLIPVLSIA